MRIVLQRVSYGHVKVNQQIIGQVDQGYVLLVGIAKGDGIEQVQQLAHKIVHLRLFDNDEGKFDYSLLDVEGGCLVVSQFTLLGQTQKGRRPDFTQAAKPDVAKPLCDALVDELQKRGVKHVQTGEFGADMDVHIQNDGPVTLCLDTDDNG